METQTADLLIIVRKGSRKLVQPTVGGLPTNSRPVVAEASDTHIRVGAQQVRAPMISRPQADHGSPRADGPRA
jgi:hypothetical protein